MLLIIKKKDNNYIIKKVEIYNIGVVKSAYFFKIFLLIYYFSVNNTNY